MKNGYKTTEFWLVLANLIGAAVGVPGASDAVMWGAAALTGVYTIIRGWVKSNSS